MRVTLHSLRVTCCSRLYDNKVDKQIIMEWSGHRSCAAVRTYKRCNEKLHEETQKLLIRCSTSVASIKAEESLECSTELLEAKVPRSLELSTENTLTLCLLQYSIKAEEYLECATSLPAAKVPSAVNTSRPLQYSLVIENGRIEYNQYRKPG